MGIEISENDHHYVNFLNSFLPPEAQIIYEEHKKAVPAPPAAKIEPIAPQKSKPVPHPKSPPAAPRKIDNETNDNEINSLISSLFSKREKKQGE